MNNQRRAVVPSRELGFLLRDVAKIRGIRTLAAGIAADVIKYDFDRAQIA